MKSLHVNMCSSVQPSAISRLPSRPRSTSALTSWPSYLSRRRWTIKTSFPSWPNLLINKIWDSVNDPIVGVISDRVHTRWGRRRPWFLFGAIPFGITFVLLFLVPPFDSTGRFWYYLIVSLMLDLAFTVVNVPYTALTPELTRDYDERTSLNSYRFAFSIGSGLLAAVLHPIIVNALMHATLNLSRSIGQNVYRHPAWAQGLADGFLTMVAAQI